MIAEQQTLTDFLGLIARMETPEEITWVGQTKGRFYTLATPEEKVLIREAILKRTDELTAIARRESEESLKILTQHGFVVDTTEWLTIKRYAERYNLTTQVVTNWISRGTIPMDCVLNLPELNDIRLVRNQPYR